MDNSAPPKARLPALLVPPPRTEVDRPHRPIRSYALRRGRISAAQQRAFEQWFSAFGAPYTPSEIDLGKLFGRAAPTVLEIGCGMGEATVTIAQSRPDVNFLAIEVFRAGVGALLKSIDEAQITNIRIIHHDAVEVVRDMLAPAALSGIHVYFPDPWPKKRHHKRRLLKQPFVQLLVSRLAPTGYLHCATDWQDYASHMLEVLSEEPGLLNLHRGYAPTPENPLCARPMTKFHARGDRLGHATCDLVFIRRPQG
ncbi:MAG: tRNA (guanosine(46)-N7)-methyltransferase TrmB [Burkholderiaceae bacterium]